MASSSRCDGISQTYTAEYKSAETTSIRLK